MGKAKSRKLRDLMRDVEYKRKQELLREKRQQIQDQFTHDYVKTHSEIARKNDNYPVTEKVFKGTPEELESLLLLDCASKLELEVDPSDYPQGLVLP